MLDTIHRLLAYAAVVVVVAGIAWSIALVVSGRSGGPRFAWYQAAVVSVLFVGAASGMTLFLSGVRPAEGLHLLYAVIAVGLVPLARSYLGQVNGGRGTVLVFVVFVVLGAVLYRLFTTG